MAQLYVCPSCKYSTKFKSDMKRHLYRQTMCLKPGGVELSNNIREIVLRDHVYTSSASKRNKYICPRCNYSTIQKSDIRTHLYRKNICSDTNGLELTDDIREKVIINHVYRPTITSVSCGENMSVDKLINQTINNNYQINNYVSQLNLEDKLVGYLDYHGKHLMDIEEHLESHFDLKSKRLEDPRYRATYGMERQDFLELVNGATKVDSDRLDHFNVIYDQKIKQLKMYRGKWETTLLERGVCDLVSLIKSYFLNNYEIYLIRRIHDSKRHFSDRNDCRRHLEEYYQFLVAFDLLPDISTMDDDEVLGRNLIEGRNDYLQDHHLEKYYEIKGQTKPSDCQKMRRQVIEIVKQNTVHNIQEVNKCMISLLKIDQDFQTKCLDLQNK